MGHSFGKAKQGAEQKTDKDGKTQHKSNDEKALIEFMKAHYDLVQNAQGFDDFYHGIYEMIELFCEERGQSQYKIPSTDRLRKQYEAVKMGQPPGKLTRGEFIKLAENLVDVGSFHLGRDTINVLMVLFGFPACALLAKRIVPGFKSFSEDIVIPAATSGAVVYLAKTNKL